MGTGSGTNFSTTPNMGLRQPIPGVCGALGVEPPGTSWLECLNAGLGLLDSHNHTPGFGAQVPSAGIGINADLSFNGFNATGLRTARFNANPGLNSGDIGSLSVVGVDLVYLDLNGNQIQITAAGGVAGTPGSIGGLVSPAAVSYASGPKLFSFISSAGFAAGISLGPLVLTDAQNSVGKAATIQVPNGLAANYTMTLPGALPAARAFLSLDNLGNVASGPNFLGGLTTAHLATAAGILGSQLAASAGIVGAQLTNNTVTRTQLSAVNQHVSGSCGAFSTVSTSYVNVTNLTVTFTPTGRPVMLLLQPDTTGTPAFVQETGAAGQTVQVALLRDGTVIGAWKFDGTSGTASSQFGSAMAYLDTGASNAAHTWTVQALTTPSGTGLVQNFVLAAYEL